MHIIKKIVAVLLMAGLMLILCSCGESSSDRLKRLDREATEARQAAKEAQDNYRQLKDVYDAIKK